ncbi:MAG: type II secretion system F family protein [Pirellulaceae bacterium]|nr:type II secretion system F family protein [Pirellulaceae bacterium]
MNTMMIAALVFFGVAALVGGAVMLWRDKPISKIEDRLEILTGTNTSNSKTGAAKESSILAQPLDDRPGYISSLVSRFGKLGLLLEQADTDLTILQLLLISVVVAVLGICLGAVVRIHPALLPLVGLCMGGLPFVWLLWRRKRRLKVFASQLPDALEMISRTLRAGQGLAFGFNMVSTEMPAPISKEFGRVFEEQNLGIPMDESLRDMTDRIPNLDLKFFVTALILQRQTGGDLAEILDKIGELVRDRFRIWGQVQALTGEGRLSGVVLLALPFVLFIAVYQLNPDYLMALFNDPLGTRMLIVAAIMQIVGALVIRKIVNIKV